MPRTAKTATTKTAKSPAKKTLSETEPVKTRKQRADTGKLKPRRRELDFSHLHPVNANINMAFVKVRDFQKLTMKDFGISLGIAEEKADTYIKGVERGSFTPTHAVIMNLRNTYKVSLDWIYGI